MDLIRPDRGHLRMNAPDPGVGALPTVRGLPVSLGLGIVGTASPGSLALGRAQARLRPGQRFQRANAADFRPVWGGDHQQILNSDVRPHHRMFGM